MEFIRRFVVQLGILLDPDVHLFNDIIIFVVAQEIMDYLSVRRQNALGHLIFLPDFSDLDH